ncbi:MAG: S8 family serine peptidase, partial [Candidatus Thiodiazotropha sp.]
MRFNHAQADIEQPQALAKSIKKGMAGSSIQQAVARPQNARPLIRSRSKAKQNKSSIAQINALSTKRKGPREELEEYIILSYPNREALEAAKKALENDPNVLWVGENEPITPLVEPSDPFYKKPTVGIGPQVPRDVDYQWAMEALNMSEVWDYSRGHAYIAAVDTGIEISHPDLQANFRSHFSYDFADNDDNVDELVTPALHAGHGTNVAGILAATPDNDIGVAGLCWDCSLMIAKTAKSTSSHPTFFIGAVSSSIVGMVDNGAQVINMSFGGANDPCQDPLNVFCKAIEYAESNDVVMAAAAGNESIQDVDFPARHPDVISVGAVDINLTKPVWSSFGPGLELDILAPGEHILSTFY